MKVSELLDRLARYHPDLEVVIFTDPEHRKASPLANTTLLAFDAAGACYASDEIDGGPAACGLLTPEATTALNKVLSGIEPNKRMVQLVTEVVREHVADPIEREGIIAAAKVLGVHFPLPELRQLLGDRKAQA